MKKWLCWLEDIRHHKAMGFEATHAGWQNIFIVWSEQGCWGYQNACPHTGVNLNWQPHQFLNVDETYIQCAVHGALFEQTTGRCIRGPCVDQMLTPVKLECDDHAIYWRADD